MKKKDLIFISIIIILLISLIITIIYFNKNKEYTIEGEILLVGSNYLLLKSNDNIDYVINTNNTNYQVGTKLKIDLIDIKTNKTPYEGTAKNINTISSSNIDNEKINIENNMNNSNDDDLTNNITKNNNQTTKQENYTETDIISYFEKLNNELTTYNNNNETLGKTLKSNFVKCIDFIIYNEQINGITFSELTNNTKLKILSLTLSIDTKIDNKFPGYKDSINNTYQNIKSKIIENI